MRFSDERVGKIILVSPDPVMKKTQSTRPIWSQGKIVLIAAGTALGVLAASLLMQYDL